MIATASAGPSAFWYLTRGTGTVTLILLTVSVVLGVANVRGARTANVPRFVFESVHRTASLLAVAFMFVHIGTSLIDGFAPIRLIDTVVPFNSAYRPLWLGFGAVASDLLIAVALTSVLRRRFGYRAWRATHWAAYACWPIALVHGLGTGSDTRTTWMLFITGGCVIAVIVAVVARATAGWPNHVGARSTAIAASAFVPLGLLVWLPSGPLAAGWAKRAGTPPSLLRAISAGSGATASGSAASAFTAQVTGTVTQRQLGDRQYEIAIPLTVAGQRLSALEIRIEGQPIAGGGVEMTNSRVTLGTASDRALYRGRVTGLSGTTVEARVQDANGTRLQLLAQLQLDQGSGSASGTLTASPGGGQ